MPLTYFKDRRTGAVYVTKEATLPTEGLIPVKPAYKSDTVWLDRVYADKIKDPHLMGGARLAGFFLGLLGALAAWFFTSYQTHIELDITLVNALYLELGWTILIWSFVCRVFGLVKI